MPAGKLLSTRQLHDLRYFLLGIRVPELVESEWKRMQEKTKAVAGKRRRR